MHFGALCMRVARRKGKQRYFQMIVVAWPSFAKVDDDLKRRLECFVLSPFFRPVVNAATRFYDRVFNVSVFMRGILQGIIWKENNSMKKRNEIISRGREKITFQISLVMLVVQIVIGISTVIALARID